MCLSTSSYLCVKIPQSKWLPLTGPGHFLQHHLLHSKEETTSSSLSRVPLTLPSTSSDDVTAVNFYSPHKVCWARTVRSWCRCILRKPSLLRTRSSQIQIQDRSASFVFPRGRVLLDRARLLVPAGLKEAQTKPRSVSWTHPARWFVASLCYARVTHEKHWCYYLVKH